MGCRTSKKRQEPSPLETQTPMQMKTWDHINRRYTDRKAYFNPDFFQVLKPGEQPAWVWKINNQETNDED